MLSNDAGDSEACSICSLKIMNKRKKWNSSAIPLISQYQHSELVLLHRRLRRGVQGMEEEVKGWGMIVLEPRQPFVRYGNVRWWSVVGDVAAPQFFNTTIPPPTCPSSPLNTVAAVPACSVRIRKRDNNCVTQFKIDEKIIVTDFHIKFHHWNSYCESVNLWCRCECLFDRL